MSKIDELTNEASAMRKDISSIANQGGRTPLGELTDETKEAAVSDNATEGIHSCVEDIRQIIDNGRKAAYLSVNAVMVQTYWNIGKRIVEEEQNGKERADYGKKIIKQLATELSFEYGNGFSERNLRNFRAFYLKFPDSEIWQTRLPNLTWSHFCRLLSVDDDNARYWYLNEANEQMWSVRTLDRNVSTQYYHRLMQSPEKQKVIAEMQQKTAEFQKNKYELIKNPIVAEFLGFGSTDYSETDLEKAIITHLRDFLMELGRGFAFVARQQHIVTETDDYFIDLVFYNIELKCYVLIDLKIGKITHQDVGQMDMYVRMYDDLKRKNDDNPTIGIVLCSKTDEDIARYSILHDSNQVFMAKYMTYLPSEDELRAEIETQKQMFYLQQKEQQL